MVRILAASDTHGDSALVRKLAEQAEKEKVDVVILCGDLTSHTSKTEIIKPFKDKGQKVVIIPGNHETSAFTDTLAKKYAIDHLHGNSIIHEDIAIFGAGGSTDFTAFLEHQTEESLFNKIKSAHDKIKHIKKKVLITHMHPYGEQSKLLDISASRAITKAIETFKPSMHLHGHIHETFGFEEKIGETQVFNVGREGRILEL